jgi:hypothetical protein
MPDETPKLLLPFPLPDDALTDYPAAGRDLSETLEALLLSGVRKLYDSTEAGVVWPAYGLFTGDIPGAAECRALIVVVSDLRSEYPVENQEFLIVSANEIANGQYVTYKIEGVDTAPPFIGWDTQNGYLLWRIPCGANANTYGYSSAGLIYLPNTGQLWQALAIGGGAAGNTPALANASLSFGLNYGVAGPIRSLSFSSYQGNRFTAGRFTVYGLGYVPPAVAQQPSFVGPFDPAEPAPTTPPKDEPAPRPAE